MEVTSMQSLCEILIYFSIQRCRMQDDLCRLTVELHEFNATLTRVSVSDTGVGSTLEEFQDLRYSNTSVLANEWDGMISVATTSVSDNELLHININLKEITSLRRITKLPSTPKNGAKFSGTAVSLSTSQGVDDLLADMTFFLQKMLILKYPNVAIELLVHRGSTSRPECDSRVLAMECSSLPSSASYLEWMKLGLENYVLKHGNQGNSICNSCFSTRELLKVGTGVACCSGGLQSGGQIFEAIIVISETLEQASPSCCMTVDTKTEILYFEDLTPCSISQSSLDALTSIKWKSYGLTLKSIYDHDGCACVEWENLPPRVHIDIALHCYRKQVVKLQCARNSQLLRTLTRKAIVYALKELKGKNKGILLSERALKICNYAPDLAKTISCLILSSNDTNFKGECCSLLGIEYQEMEENAVENCIKERIVSAIGINDREPRKNRDSGDILFEDDCLQKSDLMDEEYGEGEEYSSGSMTLLDYSSW